MKESKDHLNIDLEFLDKKESVRVAPKQASPNVSEPNWRYYDSNKANSNTGKQYNWKNILIIGGVILFFIWVNFSDESNDTTSTPATNTFIPPAESQTSNSDLDNVTIGQYSCSRFHYNQAVLLNPDETKQQIDDASATFDFRNNAMEQLKDEIDSLIVGDYSEQWEIDNYNEKVDDYNAKLPAFKRDLADLDARIDRYNAQILKHNNYLETNCTKKY